MINTNFVRVRTIMQRRSGLYSIGTGRLSTAKTGELDTNENTVINCTSVTNIFVDYSNQRRLHFTMHKMLFLSR